MGLPYPSVSEIVSPASVDEETKDQGSDLCKFTWLVIRRVSFLDMPASKVAELQPLPL